MLKHLLPLFAVLPATVLAATPTPLLDAVATPSTSSASTTFTSSAQLYQQALLFLNNNELKQAVPLLQQAAEKGSAEAQYQLALLYAGGRGVKQSPQLAGKWLQSSAEQGFAEAQYQLGVMYAEGKGVPEDPSMALQWLKAAAPSLPAAAERLKQLQHMLRTRYTNDFYQSLGAAEQGDKLSMFKLAVMYQEGIGTAPNLKLAREWLIKAAEANVADAQARLGVQYYHGGVVDQNYEQAEYWLTKAAELGEPASMGLLGTMFRDGTGVKANVTTAMQWFILSAYHGNEHALASLDRLIKEGSTPVQQQSAQQAALLWIMAKRGISPPAERPYPKEADSEGLETQIKP